jgi:hypothetical protein
VPKKLTINDIEDMLGCPWERGSFGPDTYDCWGAVHEGLKRAGCTGLINVDYAFPDGIDAEFDTGRSDGRWSDKQPQAGNSVVLCYRGGQAVHVGLLIDGMVLHTPGNPGKPGSVVLTRLATVARMFTKLEFLEWLD